MVVSRAPPLGSWPASQACALTENRTGDPLVHRPAFNSLSHTSQVLIFFFLKITQFYLFFKFYLFTFEREGKEGRETSLCEKYINCLSHAPEWGWGAWHLILKHGYILFSYGFISDLPFYHSVFSHWVISAMILASTTTRMLRKPRFIFISNAYLLPEHQTHISYAHPYWDIS